jgi:hypothetical protein
MQNEETSAFYLLSSKVALSRGLDFPSLAI